MKDTKILNAGDIDGQTLKNLEQLSVVLNHLSISNIQYVGRKPP